MVAVSSVTHGTIDACSNGVMCVTFHLLQLDGYQLARSTMLNSHICHITVLHATECGTHTIKRKQKIKKCRQYLNVQNAVAACDPLADANALQIRCCIL